MEPEEHYEDDFEDATDEEAGHEHAGADAGADTTGVAWQDVNVAELELGEQIGGGGFSLVHRARWNRKHVAVKVLFDPKVNDALKREFMDELHVMARLHHPHVVRLLAACVRPPKMCFVMELCTQSLFQLLHLSRTPLSPKQLLTMALEVAGALEYLHVQRPIIIHRDLKSHNVLLDAHGTVKLCDFGLVSTKATTAGTPCYMAPELLANRPFSCKVDVYAFGILLWELFAREVPFDGLEPPTIKEQVLAGVRPRVPRLDCPEEVRDMMQRCWAPEPAERPLFPQIVQELQELAERTRAISHVQETGMGAPDALEALMRK